MVELSSKPSHYDKVWIGFGSLENRHQCKVICFGVYGYSKDCWTVTHFIPVEGSGKRGYIDLWFYTVLQLK